MRKGIVVDVRAEDRARLAAIVANRNSPQKHVWRARIVLLTADGLGTAAIMRQTGKSKSVVWRWQERFMQAGVYGLLRDKTRPSRKPPLDKTVIAPSSGSPRQAGRRPSTRPPAHPARPADEERPSRHDDPRLQAQRHDHAVRRIECPGRYRHRPLHAAPSASGVHPLPQCRRGAGAGRQDLISFSTNYATHKHPKVMDWLARHPRFVFHLTPTSASWLNTVEGFFAKLTRRRLKRGVFRSIVDLQAAINHFIEEVNGDPKPFVWTANPDKTIAAVKRGHQALGSIH